GARTRTSAEIPHFRKPVTVLYPYLQTLNLPHPAAAFGISFFRTNSQPLYILTKSLNPGQSTPTTTHAPISQTERTCSRSASPRT
ncbi:hypothetical protein HOY80DRAFT_881078, partial [Tuber brumale]